MRIGDARNLWIDIDVIEFSTGVRLVQPKNPISFRCTVFGRSRRFVDHVDFVRGGAIEFDLIVLSLCGVVQFVSLDKSIRHLRGRLARFLPIG